MSFHVLTAIEQAVKTDSPHEVIRVLEKHRPDFNHDVMEVLFSRYGGIFNYFQFDMDKAEDHQAIRQFLAKAMKPQLFEVDDTPLQRLYKSFKLNLELCANYQALFDSELYADVEEDFLSDLSYLWHYKEMILPVMTMEQQARLLSSNGYMESYYKPLLVNQLLECELIDPSLLAKALEMCRVCCVCASVKDKYASEMLAANPFNYKHLSVVKRQQLHIEVDFTKFPMLLKHKPSNVKLEPEIYSLAVQEDPRSIRFVPSEILFGPLFDDEVLIDMLKVNQRKGRSRYRLLSMLERAAPGRVNKQLVNACIELGFHERHHQLAQRILKNQK